MKAVSSFLLALYNNFKYSVIMLIVGLFETQCITSEAREYLLLHNRLLYNPQLLGSLAWLYRSSYKAIYLKMAVTVLCAIFYILATICASCFGCFLFLIAYIHRMHRITDHIPGPPRSSFIMGHMQDILKCKEATGRTIAEFAMEKRFEYGPIFVLHLVHRPLAFLGGSNYLRHVYINNHDSLGKEGFT